MISRIEKILKDSGLTVNSFAKRCKLPQSNLSQQIGGTRKISVKTLTHILEAFPDVNANWLMLGIGDPYNKIDSKMDSLISVIKLQQDTIENLQETINILKQQLNK